MKETGILNRDLAELLSEQGHQDSMMICDAGFAIPARIRVVDLSLRKDTPLIDDVLKEISSHFSIERIVMANETKNISPSKFEKVRDILGHEIPVDTVEHTKLKEMSHKIKFAIRTGDFTAYSNVLLISGSGDRWYLECSGK